MLLCSPCSPGKSIGGVLWAEWIEADGVTTGAVRGINAGVNFKDTPLGGVRAGERPVPDDPVEPGIIVGGVRAGEGVVEPGIIVNGVRAGEGVVEPGIIVNGVRAGKGVVEPGIIVGGVRAGEGVVEPGIIVGGVCAGEGVAKCIEGAATCTVAASSSVAIANSVAPASRLAINLGSSTFAASNLGTEDFLNGFVAGWVELVEGGGGDAPIVRLRWLHKFAPGGGGGTATMLRLAPSIDSYLVSVLNMC
jgi:hypothetical protein